MDKLNDKNKHQNIRIKCIQFLKIISNQCNEQQLNKAFKSSINIFNDGNNDTNLRKGCAELLGAIAVNLNGKHFDDTFQCLINGLRDSDWSVQYSCVKSLVTLSKKWNEEQLDITFQCLIDGFQNINGYCCYTSRHLLEGIAMKLNETQIDFVFTCLNGLKDENECIRALCKESLETISTKLNDRQLDRVFSAFVHGFKDKYNWVREPCAESLGIIATKASEKQLEKVFDTLMSGLKDEYKSIRKSCAKSLEVISKKLNEKQLKKVVNVLMSGLKDEDKNIRESCAKSLEVISKKLNEKQLGKVVKVLISGLKDKDKNIRKSCAKSLGVISEKLNEKQLENAINTLTDGFKDKDNYVCISCAQSLGVISTNLTDKQLEGVFNALPKEQEFNYFFSYKKALEEISTKWNEKQSEKIFNALIFVSKHLINTDNNSSKDRLLVELLELISTKLNDKQLYLLVIHLLERAKTKCKWYVRDALTKISEDMWKRATICGLKENIQLKNENTLTNEETSNNRIWKTVNDTDIQLLVFGLMTFNPRIQLSRDDSNTHSDALNKLIRYCDEQAIEWKFPTHQSKWNIDRDIERPCLNNEIEEVPNDENAFKGCYTVVHEAARSGDLSKFKLVLQNHPDIDINDSCNEHRQTPLHLAINYQHWDIARYCIEQGAYIDIREGAVNSPILRTPFENIMELIIKHKNDENDKNDLDAMEMCKLILKQRTMYPMKRIEYAIDYVKDKLIDQNGVIKNIDEEDYETLLEEGATFLLGVSQKQLKETLIKNSVLYWAASRNVKSIDIENSIKKKFDKGWHPMPFLIFRIFLLFEICVRLKREGRMYEKGMKELQVQLTTYWDYITVEEFKHKCPELMDDWSYNVVHRLINLGPCNEMSLV
ncbi:hypothetical protein RFI_38068, partial [Reticulomyxa filosa]